MSTRYKLPIAFGVIVVLSVAATISGIHIESSLSSLVARLNEGPPMAVSGARSAQLDFAELRQPVERAVLLREMPSATEVASFESGMQQFRADLQVARKRMPGADSSAQIEKTKALAESWFAMTVSYFKPPAQGLQELPVPAAVLAAGDEVMGAINLVIEAASASESDFRARAEAAAGAARDNLILLNVLAVLVGLIAAIGMAYSLRRDEFGRLLSSMARSQSALREMNETRERERAEQLAAFQAQIEEERHRRQARA
jgi:hypothetical protein